MSEQNDQLNLFSETPVVKPFDADAVADHIKAVTDTPEHRAKIDQSYPATNRFADTEVPTSGHPSARVGELPLRNGVRVMTVPSGGDSDPATYPGREEPTKLTDKQRELGRAKILELRREK